MDLHSPWASWRLWASQGATICFQMSDWDQSHGLARPTTGRIFKAPSIWSRVIPSLCASRHIIALKPCSDRNIEGKTVLTLDQSIACLILDSPSFYASEVHLLQRSIDLYPDPRMTYTKFEGGEGFSSSRIPTNQSQRQSISSLVAKALSEVSSRTHVEMVELKRRIGDQERLEIQ